MVAESHAAGPLPLDNARVADRLEEVADLLVNRGANEFRVRAYRRAAQTVRDLPTPVHDKVLAEGIVSLTALPGVGARLGEVISQLALTGHFPLLDDLRAKDCPENTIASVGGIGRGLAQRIHEQLGVCSLEELERAAYDGRLEQVPGLGPKRVRSIQDALTGRRLRYDRGHPRPGLTPQPPVSELLAVDRLYRERAGAGQLRQVAPRRLNPEGAPWLPVMKLRRNGWRYRALFSNTPQAHRLGKTNDWVVLYFVGAEGAGQCTVITSGTGPLRGQRVVRGREDECARYYAEQMPTAGGDDASADAGPANGG